MDESTSQVRLTVSLTIDSGMLPSGAGLSGGGGAVITFSCEENGLQCDGEISLRLSLAE